MVVIMSSYSKLHRQAVHKISPFLYMEYILSVLLFGSTSTISSLIVPTAEHHNTILDTDVLDLCYFWFRWKYCSSKVHTLILLFSLPMLAPSDLQLPLWQCLPLSVFQLKGKYWRKTPLRGCRYIWAWLCPKWKLSNQKSVISSLLKLPSQTIHSTL